MGELLGNPVNLPVAAVGLAATVFLLWQMARSEKGRSEARMRWSPRPGARPGTAGEATAVVPERGAQLDAEQLERIVGQDSQGALRIDLSVVRHPVLSGGEPEADYVALIDQVQDRWVQWVAQRTPLEGHYRATEHFWVVCNNEQAQDQVGGVIEQVLADIRQALPAQEPVELWPGHMPVLLCVNEGEFKRTAQGVDRIEPDASMTGYFKGEGPLGHIVCLAGVGEAGTYMDLINYVGRAVLYNFGSRPGRLPRWAEEGAILALQGNCEYGAGMRADLRRLVSRSDFFTSDNFEQLFVGKGFDDPDVKVSQSAHALAFCICDFLMQRDFAAYTRMLWLLKEVDDQEEVLITNFGWGFFDLQEEVQRYCGVDLTGGKR